MCTNRDGLGEGIGRVVAQELPGSTVRRVLQDKVATDIGARARDSCTLGDGGAQSRTGQRREGKDCARQHWIVKLGEKEEAGGKDERES